MNCRLIKHRPYRTPSLCEERILVLELLDLKLLGRSRYASFLVRSRSLLQGLKIDR
jgi:hypothetical protein